MHITKINLTNFKSIRELSMELNGSVYLLTGDNEVGKSTLLQAITYLLTGERTDNLLTKGEEKGSASLETDEGYKIELNYSDKNPRGRLKITDEKGMSSNNISMLQQLIGYTDFDAHYFASLSNTTDGSRKQVEMVMKLFKLEDQDSLLSIAAGIKSLKDERKSVNVRVPILKRDFEDVKVGDDFLEIYKEPKDIDKLYEQKEECVQFNQEHTENQELLQVLNQELDEWDGKVEEDLASYDGQIKDLQQQIKDLKKQKADMSKSFGERKAVKEKEQKELEQWFVENPEQEDIEALKIEITGVKEHNENHQRVLRHQEQQGKLNEALDSQDKFNTEIELLQEQRAEIIKKAELPIEGLTFDDEGLYLNGIPFKPGEVSTSQEIEIAVRLIMAMNPNVKIFRLGQGESLGEKKMAAIVEFAKKNNFQGFIEHVVRGQEELKVEEYELTEENDEKNG